MHRPQQQQQQRIPLPPASCASSCVDPANGRNCAPASAKTRSTSTRADSPPCPSDSQRTKRNSPVKWPFPLYAHHPFYTSFLRPHRLFLPLSLAQTARPTASLFLPPSFCRFLRLRAGPLLPFWLPRRLLQLKMSTNRSRFPQPVRPLHALDSGRTPSRSTRYRCIRWHASLHHRNASPRVHLLSKRNDAARTASHKRLVKSVRSKKGVYSVRSSRSSAHSLPAGA